MPPVAWLPVASAIVIVAGVLAATASRYGYHRDELYFLMLGPAWGYVDQPPLTPLLARGASALFGDTPAGMRIPAVICVAVAGRRRRWPPGDSAWPGSRWSAAI